MIADQTYLFINRVQDRRFFNPSEASDSQFLLCVWLEQGFLLTDCAGSMKNLFGFSSCLWLQ